MGTLEGDFWNVPLAELRRRLDAEGDGLTEAEADRRRARYGPNRPAGARRDGPLRQILGLLANPLVAILLASAVVAGALGEATNAVIIAAIVSASLLLNFLQSYRAQRAAQALTASVAATARALRDGRSQEIAAEALVPGDVVLLAAGDLVPADARLLEAKDLFTDQAALTGESYPAEKDARELPEAPGDLDRALNAVFAGTSVVSGTARALVVRTGAGTAFGAIAATFEERQPPTAFERGLAGFSFLILRMVVALVLFVFLVLSLVKHQPLEAFMFAIALAVGLTPEFLPMIVTITLTRGALRMAKRRVVVKQLQAIENFGGIDVLCTDKTGTLTEGCLSLSRWVDWRGGPSEEVLAAGVLNSLHQTGIRSPLDEAILGAPHPEPETWRKLDEVPFDFHRRRLSVVLERGGRRVMIAKGAPESVLEVCRGCAGGSGAEGPGGAEMEAARATFRRLSEDGLRVLAIARREVDADPPFEPADEQGLTLLGFLAFADPPRRDVKESLEALAKDGIRVVMLTGDNEWVSRRVADAVGLGGGRVLLGHELERVRDEALPRLVGEVSVFARLTPEQKTRVIAAFKRAGHVVGYLGDGINDAPSLRMADVGISVSTAVDVAKEAASIILLEKSLATLHQGVLEGRRSFANVMKYLMMGTSSNFGNMFSMAGAAALLPFLPMLPMQILLNTFLYDLSQITLPGDRVDREAVARPRRWDIAFIRRFMLRMGPVSSLFDFLTFGLLLFAFHAGPTLFRTGWFIESLLTQTLVIFVIRTRASPLRSRPSPALAASVLGAGALGLLLPFTPLGPALGFAPPPPALLAAIAGMVAAYLALAEAMKRLFYRSAGAR